MKQSLELIDTLIELEKARDIQWKAAQIKLGHGDLSVGESSMLFHLKTLKELIKNEIGV